MTQNLKRKSLQLLHSFTILKSLSWEEIEKAFPRPFCTIIFFSTWNAKTYLS